MKLQPIENKFNNQKSYPISFQVYKGTKLTSYGYITKGKIKDYTLDIYIAQNKGKLRHKLYYLKKAEQWIKSKLIYYSNNKPYKVIRCENTNLK